MCVVCVSKRFQSLTGQESLSFCLSASNANSSSSAAAAATAATSQPHSSSASSSSVTVADLDALKQEILTEVRREILQAKQEIVEGQSVLILPVCCRQSLGQTDTGFDYEKV